MGICKAKRSTGLTLIEMLAVIGVTGIVGGIIFQHTLEIISYTKAVACQSNLRNLNTCIQDYALKEGKDSFSIVSESIDFLTPAFFDVGALPTCPVDGSHYVVRGKVICTSPDVKGHLTNR